MDEFGVLTECFGLKPQGKSTPMAASKLPTTTVNSQATPNLGSNSSLNSKPSSNPNSFNGSFLDDHGFPFSNPKSPNFGDDFDFFGGFNKNSISSKTNGFGFDYDSLFSKETAPEAKSSFDDDIFGGLKSSSSSVYNNGDDIFGPFPASKPKNSEPVDDLLGNFSSKTKSTSWNGSIGTDDLIPGFGSRKGENKGTFKSVDDPFVVLGSVSTSKFLHPPEDMSHFNNGSKSSGSSLNILQPLRPPPKPGQVLKTDKSKISDISSIDELEKFAMGRVQKINGHLNHLPNREVKERGSDRVSKYREADGPAWMTQPKSADDLDSFFGMSSHSSSIPKDPVFGMESVHASSGIKKSSSATNVVDISLMFGDLSSFGEFEEVEGDSEERRKLRFERYRRTQDRVVKAVNDMTQRGIQNMHEQEERRRISDSVDIEIKRWAAGREGNLRALLSSLQCVLWRESGWEPVSLTDLITSTSVKKVYRKANLCIHPDKVQQKRATLQQKYTAEKVFDILKEAYNKFQKQELS